MQTITQHIILDGAKAAPCNPDGVPVAAPASVVVGQKCLLAVRSVNGTGAAVAVTGASGLSQRFVIGQDYDAATTPLFSTANVVWNATETGFTVDLSGTRTAAMLERLGTAESASLVCELACYDASEDESPEHPGFVIQWPIVILNRVDSFADVAPSEDASAAFRRAVAEAVSDMMTDVDALPENATQREIRAAVAGIITALTGAE